MTSLSRRAALTLPMAMFVAPARAHSVRRGQLSIGHAWMLPSRDGTSQGFVPLSLASGPGDALLAVESPLARRVVFRRGADPVARIDVPAGRGVPMRPGALHLAFEGLTRPLALDDRVPATLVFERAGRIDHEFWVEDQPYGGGAPRER